MGGGARFLFFLFLPVFCLPHVVDAGVVVNELYYDHPGADAGYEFVELLNTADAAVSLDGVALEFHNGTGEGWTVLWQAPSGLVVESGSLFMLGGDLVLPLPDIVTAMSLQNGPDAIRIVHGVEILDVVGYGGLDDPAYVETLGVSAVDAGQSIARTPDGRDTGDNASDFVESAPTPGRRNVARHDASATPAPETPTHAGLDHAGVDRLMVDLENRGLIQIPAAAVVISVFDSTVGDIASTVNASSIVPGATERVALEVSLSAPGYHWLTIEARYPLDERAANDRASLVRRVGRPPLLVSEVMSAPRDGCPQFVELYNAGSTHLDITGFSIRDTRPKPAVIAADSLIVGPREFVVVTPDPEVLRSCVRVDGRVFDVDGTWPSFNKSGGSFADSVVVMDTFAISVDAVAYPGLKTDQADLSLERIDLFASETRRSAVWSLSRERGGSPGRMGASALASPPRAACEVSPNPFFAGDLLRVAVASTDGVASVSVRIYDPSGRRVADIGTASSFPAVLLWDGRSADGEMVRAGIFVLACESFTSDGARVGVEKVVVGCASHSP